MTEIFQGYFVKFKAPSDKRFQFVARVIPDGTVIPTRLRIHASRMDSAAAADIASAIRSAGWTAKIEIA